MNTPFAAPLPQGGASRRKAPPPAVGPILKREGAYRTIAEMAAELGVATHVLRFWESKFPQLQPTKGAGGRRFYGPEAATVARRIQGLLYVEKLTIKGAQAVLAGKTKDAADPLAPQALAAELRQVLALLEEGPA